MGLYSLPKAKPLPDAFGSQPVQSRSTQPLSGPPPGVYTGIANVDVVKYLAMATNPPRKKAPLQNSPWGTR